MAKTCRTCGETKDEGGFYNRQTQCKICNMAKVRAWISRNPEKYKEYSRKAGRKPEKVSAEKARYRLKEKDREAIKAKKERYNNKNPEKHSANMKVMYALRVGKLIRPDNCQICKKNCKPHGHHEDYSKPLMVDWLCRECHCERHKEIRDKQWEEEKIAYAASHNDASQVSTLFLEMENGRGS